MFESLRRLFSRAADRSPVMPPGYKSQGLAADDAPDIIVTEIDLSPLPDEQPPQSAEDADLGPPSRHAKTDRTERFKKAFTQVDDDVWGVSFVIRYRDAAGAISVRRVTVRNLFTSNDGETFAHCLCHERKALRMFRIDRIEEIVDIDGVVHVPSEFFARELGVHIAPRPAPILTATVTLSRPVAARVEPPGHAQRREARDGIRLLAALSRADGVMHEAEVAVILDYIEEVCGRAGIAVTDQDRAALAAYVRRQYPGGEVVDECLDRMGRQEPSQQKAFMAAAIALIDADGEQHPLEFEMLMELKARLAD